MPFCRTSAPTTSIAATSGDAPAPESRPEIPNVDFHTFHMPSLRDLPLPSLPRRRRRSPSRPEAAIRRRLPVARREARGAPAARGRARRSTCSTPTRRTPCSRRGCCGVAASPAARRALPGHRHASRAEGSPALLPSLRGSACAQDAAPTCYIMTDDGTQGDEVLARLNPASKGRVKFWRNGLDLDRLRPPDAEQRSRRAPRSRRSPDDAFVMLTASRLATWKRVDRAIRALPKVRAWAPDAHARRRRRRRGARAARSARAIAAGRPSACASSAPCRSRM